MWWIPVLQVRMRAVHSSWSHTACDADCRSLIGYLWCVCVFQGTCGNSHLNPAQSCLIQINTFARFGSIRRNVSYFFDLLCDPSSAPASEILHRCAWAIVVFLFWVKNSKHGFIFSCWSSTINVCVQKWKEYLLFFHFTSHIPPDFPQTLTTSSSYLLCLICLAACSGRLPAASVYI